MSRVRAKKLNEAVSLVSWNMQRSGIEGKIDRVLDILRDEDTGFVLLQEINQFTFDRILARTFVKNEYSFEFADANCDAHGLGQAMFVRNCYGGRITNQTVLEGLAKGRSNLIWVSTDTQRAVAGIHCNARRGADAVRLDHIQSIQKHCSSFAFSHILCGDLNMSRGFLDYRYVAGGAHQTGEHLDGCLVHNLTSAIETRVVYQDIADNAGFLNGSDHPICAYSVTWHPTD